MRAASASPFDDLFAESPLPHGLVYRADFIAPGEERALVALMTRLPFVEARFQQYTARRRVVRFGALYDEAAHAWTQGPPLPPEIDALRTRVAEAIGIEPQAFVHALATEYRAGTPIGWHRDKPHYGIVAGVSLGTACRMRFRPLDSPQNRRAAFAVELAPRSLYVMRDAIRWAWQHHIPPTQGLRHSITLRTRHGGRGTDARAQDDR